MKDAVWEYFYAEFKNRFHFSQKLIFHHDLDNKHLDGPNQGEKLNFLKIK